MTGQEARGSAHLAGRFGASLNLIHTNNCSKPALARVSGRFDSSDEGVSEAVVGAVFTMVVKLQQGGYDQPTR